MKLIPLKCPVCSASLEIDGEKEYCTCKYCRSTFAKKTIQETTSAGVVTENSLLDRAFLFLEDSKFKEADQYFEKVLDINPRCSKAYIGKLLCQLKLKSINSISYTAEHLKKTYDYYNKAIKFATAEEMAEYEQMNARNALIFNAEKSMKEHKILEIQKFISEKEKYLSENKLDNKFYAKKFLYSMLLALSALAIVFFGIGVTVAFPIIIFVILSVVWMIFMIKKIRKMELKDKEYNEVKMHCENAKSTLLNEQRNYNQWLQINT